MAEDYCCEMMKQDLERVCDKHPNRIDCADNMIDHGKDGRWGLFIHDGTHSFYEIFFCPWCGTVLRSAHERMGKDDHDGWEHDV